MFTSIQKFLKGSKISESTNYQKPHIKTTDLRSLKKYANLPFILESNDQSIASTKTKYIKLNTKTQFFFNNIRLLYTL